ncbi:helix-turn-helix domain-containing protein [Brucella gallinifaecis]|uniref:Helix-turn-helix transcriptional regulator n=1 Tax=Brucella gallinifaecis TaxID=215590 RepID=A0A502BUD7_9HYPH|nr:helix-turn-helix transcriptional regulator [Brucella gallinifaecis]TPF76708.1 helix-turn-helix transcriptional regulator [Brucella gallinifaecis]
MVFFACNAIPNWYVAGMEKLKTYLKDNGLSHDAFAKEVDATQATITRYVRGDRFPTPQMIVKIAKATNGEITASDWYASSAGAA